MWGRCRSWPDRREIEQEQELVAFSLTRASPLASSILHSSKYPESIQSLTGMVTGYKLGDDADNPCLVTMITPGHIWTYLELH